MAILVSNAMDSSDEICEGGCLSWRLHWENNTGITDYVCSVIDCYEDGDLVGGHVYREDEDGDD